jgi:retinol dehydrogenase-12
VSGSFLHRKLVRAPLAPVVDLTGKKMIVTGGAPGSIGGETARILTSWGADVVITTRAGGLGARPLDLSDARSVEAFADWYQQTQGGQLDVLVNNAGVHLDLLSKWKEPLLLADGHEIHWRTNYLGTMHLTSLLLPLLSATGERSGAARVVNVVSKLHARASNAGLLEAPDDYNSWVAYGRSKLGLIHAANEIARRYPHVQAYSLHPGEVFTDIASKGLAGHRLIGGVRRALRPLEAFFLMTPAEGAQTSVFAATQPGLAGGQYLRKCAPAEPAPDAADARVSALLWQQTVDWVSSVRG